jgi:hypothetical protein
MSLEHAIDVVSFRSMDGGEQHNYGCICQLEVGDHCPEVERALIADGNTPMVAMCLSRRSALAASVTAKG